MSSKSVASEVLVDGNVAVLCMRYVFSTQICILYSHGLVCKLRAKLGDDAGNELKILTIGNASLAPVPFASTNE